MNYELLHQKTNPNEANSVAGFSVGHLKFIKSPKKRRKKLIKHPIYVRYIKKKIETGVLYKTKQKRYNI